MRERAGEQASKRASKRGREGGERETETEREREGERGRETEQRVRDRERGTEIARERERERDRHRERQRQAGMSSFGLMSSVPAFSSGVVVIMLAESLLADPSGYISFINVSLSPRHVIQACTSLCTNNHS